MLNPGARNPLALLLATLLPATASASLQFRYEALLPGPQGDGSLDRPSGVTVDPVSQEVCVTDGGRVRLDVYTPLGVHTFETGEIAGLVSPCDGTVETWGGFVCTDYGPDGKRTIKRLNFLGEPVAYTPERPDPEWAPEHLLVTRDGDYVTVDNRSGILAKHDSETGALLWKRRPTDGSPDEEMLLGKPAESPDGKIYLPAGELHRVLIFSAEGEPLASFGRPGTAPGELACPVGVAFGSLGRVLVLDRMRHTVLVYDGDFRFLREFGTFGSRPGNLYHPVAIAALPDGRLWVAQGFEGRVQAFLLSDEDGRAVPAASGASS